MTAERLVWKRAILMAFSTASAPVVRKMVFLGVAPGASAFSCFGERDVALVGGHLEAGVA